MNRQSGVTIVELMIVLAVIGVLAALAVPSFQEQFERRRLVGAAELVYSQLSYAKTESLKRSRPIVVEFAANGSTTWAFGITDKANCTPTVTAPADASACTIEFDNDAAVDFDGDGSAADPLLRRWDSTEYQGVSMAAPTFGARTSFEPVRGIANAGTVSLTSANYQIDVRLSVLGRVRMCSPAGAKVGGYPDC